MKIVTILGARPQFIKAAMVSKEIAKHIDLDEVIIHTGQHFDENMSHIFFEEMGILKPDYNLEIQSLSHGAMTGRQLEEIEKVLIQEKPNWVLVYGDTNSTLAGALAAAKLHIPVAHVEAGLRSFNYKMPEEINRVVTDHLSDILFAPTKIAVENLRKEGIPKAIILMVGDVMYDAALHFADLAEKKSKILSSLNLKPKEYILATVHRQENTDDPDKLNNIFSGLAEAHIPVVIPLHPRTKKKLEEYNITLNGQINSINPVGYLDMIMLEKHANKIATDSGGVQKEAYFYNVPCITMREETEWIELVEIGANYLSGSDYKKIVELLQNSKQINFQKSLYGDGNTAEKIVSILLKE
tara:strand:+ start:474 stop:1538 length:1065 start_codon:yes stop_codon:yes gene_type:complete